MEDCLRGIKNVVVFLDNIFITGKNREVHLETLEQTMQRLEETGLKVNPKRCTFLKKE